MIDRRRWLWAALGLSAATFGWAAKAQPSSPVAATARGARATPAAACAERQGDSGARSASLLAAEDRLLQAEARRDVKGIAEGFASEAVFMHANGMRETKSEYIEAVRSGALPYRSITISDRFAKVAGDLGVTRGTMRLVVGDMHLGGTYLAVYIMRDGRWQMLDWQSTPEYRGSSR